MQRCNIVEITRSGGEHKISRDKHILS